MEVIEDGNIMDRIPILLQRDLEYYQTNQTVLSETICHGVVGGRLDFPRNASFAAAKIVLWLEEEFSIAFKHGSGMFVTTEEKQYDAEVAKTSDPDKFVQLAKKTSDSLLEHLHVLVQEALDHADLPVLIATLGAAALLKNSLYCFMQHTEDSGAERHSLIQSCYKRYVTMFEAVGERVLDLHNRVLSLYVIQDSGGRPIDDLTRAVHECGTPSIQGWWLYMNGSKKDLWDTVPPRMAQRIFAGMLNETLTILTVRYCQTNTTESTTKLLINDILNILLCVAQLLPAICSSGFELCGLQVSQLSRDVRDVHAKCNELFKCLVYRGAELHFLHQAFSDNESTDLAKDTSFPWYTFVSPMFDKTDDLAATNTLDLSTNTAVGLELIVLLAQPQPSWALLVKTLMMRDCYLCSALLINAMKHMSPDNSRWPANGLWYSQDGQNKCKGFLCTADGFCTFTGDSSSGEEYARTVGALTYILVTIGSKAEVKSTLSYALEISGRDWAACLDKRQVWCDRRPPWLAGMLGVVGNSLQFVPAVLVNAVQTGASMYQTMSLCLSCISRTMNCIPRCLLNACQILEGMLTSTVSPVGGSILLQLLITVVYEELQKWAKREMVKENVVSNGEAYNMNVKHTRTNLKHVRIVSQSQNSSSFDSAHSTPSSLALAIAEALCSIDEDDKHTVEITNLVAQSKKQHTVTNNFGLEDFPEFAEFFEEGSVPASNAERASDAAALTSEILMTDAGKDSLRVIYDHLQLHCDRIYRQLGIEDSPDTDSVKLNKAPLLYIMFHIGRRPFDQYLRGEWRISWSKLASTAKSWSGVEGAKVHINRRTDIRNIKTGKASKQLTELYNIFKTPSDCLL